MAIKLVVGLGNPGRKYESTRHNVGRRVLNWLEENPLPGVTLMTPDVFMNSSGTPVAEKASKKGLKPEEILVVCDDFMLPLTKLRFRKGGSSGGHNGLDSILNTLQTKDVPRLRIGIGPVPPGEDPADFVLKPFRPAERVEIEHVIVKAANAVIVAIKEGLDVAMNQYNADPV